MHGEVGIEADGRNEDGAENELKIGFKDVDGGEDGIKDGIVDGAEDGTRKTDAVANTMVKIVERIIQLLFFCDNLPKAMRSLTIVSITVALYVKALE